MCFIKENQATPLCQTKLPGKVELLSPEARWYYGVDGKYVERCVDLHEESGELNAAGGEEVQLEARQALRVHQLGGARRHQERVQLCKTNSD